MKFDKQEKCFLLGSHVISRKNALESSSEIHSTHHGALHKRIFYYTELSEKGPFVYFILLFVFLVFISLRVLIQK